MLTHVPPRPAALPAGSLVRQDDPIMPHTDRDYRLLIVDDDETDRRLYGWLLERQAPGAFEIDLVHNKPGLAARWSRKRDHTAPELLTLAGIDIVLAHKCQRAVCIDAIDRNAGAQRLDRIGVQMASASVPSTRLWATERQRRLRVPAATPARPFVPGPGCRGWPARRTPAAPDRAGYRVPQQPAW